MIFIFFLLSEANFKIFLVELMSLKNIFLLSESPTSPEPAQCITVSILAKYLSSILFLILLFVYFINVLNLSLFFHDLYHTIYNHFLMNYIYSILQNH